MNATTHPAVSFSAFMTSHLSDFFDNYGINFCIDGPQLEYFVYNKITMLDISCSLTVNFDEMDDRINIMSFYPGLWQHPGTRYFSAVCFFMILNHVANFYHIEKNCRICLKTKKIIFDEFYSLLKDLDFHILLVDQNELLEIESHFLPPGIDTSMFIERALVS